MDELHAVMPAKGNVLLLGSAPPTDSTDTRAGEDGPHLIATWLDIATGELRLLDLTLASLQQLADPAAADPARDRPARR
jgi:hypothetical protein